ncbi:hypothetical protein PILCRDRAFT_15148 [Piloderma croceum F 1598]|uniref:Uncharacterized protein n=1 Tax=Piloderma croceum (strain F 1598) TaxID=765440 RepID=A0A0C3AIC7_PILCF|nr:hypothetical protein PILCRDRAFT_15148 [Piloderma croceum F 1598]
MLFIAIFLTVNCLYSTSALPTVSGGGIAAGQSLNLTHSLAKRAEIPPDQKCHQPSDWIGRRCMIEFGNGDDTWADQCLGDDRVLYWELGTCPPNTMCTNKFILPETITIVCINRPAGITDTGANQQTGVAQIGASAEPAREHIVSIPVLNPIPGASVSVFMEGTDGTYIIAANAAIVGSLRGTTATACNYNVTNRDCVPTGQYDLGKGNILDFTFGLGYGQVVRFYYAMIGGS